MRVFLIRRVMLYMMSGSKAPDSDAYGLFRATHSHNPTLKFSKFNINNCQIRKTPIPIKNNFVKNIENHQLPCDFPLIQKKSQTEPFVGSGRFSAFLGRFMHGTVVRENLDYNENE